MKVHIFYRHYNTKENYRYGRPIWFNYENCLKNLLETIQSKDVSLNIVYDGKLDDGNFIHKYKDQVNKIYEVEGGTDFKSFQKTCEIIKNDSTINEKDIVYLLENDYLHIDDWVEKLTNLYSTYQGLSYVTLYDCNDKYFAPMYEDLVSKLIVTDKLHWRTTPSTCNSFSLSKKSFDEDYDILSTMEGDHNKFLWLTENRNRFVLSPMPGLSTHCMEFLMSPIIDWKLINNKYE
jgi:hypothetical protein